MGSGRPKLYWRLVQDLDNEKSLSIAELVRQSDPSLFPKHILDAHGLAETRERAINALRGRARQYAIPYRIEAGQRKYRVYRLKLSFSDSFLKRACSAGEFRELKRLEQQSVSPRNKLAFKRFKKPLLFVAGVLFLTAAVAVLRPRAYDILKGQGVSAALAYITNVKIQTEESVYQRAWIEYRANHHEAAAQKALALLGDPRTSAKRGADCFYLLGEIKAATGFFRVSLGHYTEAHLIYQRLNRPQNLYLTSLGKAKALISMDQLDDAQAELNDALQWQRSAKDSNLGLYYSLLTALEIRKANYASALQAAMTTASIHEENENNDGLAMALSDVGFLQILLGNTREGLANTRRAEYLAVELGDRGKYVCNLVNYVLDDRLRNREPLPFVLQTIEDWIVRYNDRDLEYYLDLTETVY